MTYADLALARRYAAQADDAGAPPYCRIIRELLAAAFYPCGQHAGTLYIPKIAPTRKIPKHSHFR
jgi:hypothetical protein